MLEGADLDLAVARGAAYYGLVRRGHGIRIRGGTARAYYIGVETAVPAVPGIAPPVKALCVAPFGMEEGTRVDAAGPASSAWSSASRPSSASSPRPAASTIAPGRWSTRTRPSSRSWRRSRPTCPPRPARAAGQLVPVTLEAHVTEVGTLELWCVGARRRGAGSWSTRCARIRPSGDAALSDERARYLVGIDLGTTNTAVAYVDTPRGRHSGSRMFAVPQLVAPGEVAPRRQLPSFVYLAGEHDLAPAETALPWDAAADAAPVVGELARAQGARMAGRLIASAKSWLCHARRRSPGRHPAVGRRDGRGHAVAGRRAGARSSRTSARPGITRTRDGGRVRRAGGRAHRAGVVRRGGARADPRGGRAGPATRRSCCSRSRRPRSTPGSTHPAGARAAALGAAQRVLVFDVGGGTTDFTLIAVGADGEAFERIAVGDHLLLGGDNIDLALAKMVEQRLVAASGQASSTRCSGTAWSTRAGWPRRRCSATRRSSAVPITVRRAAAKLIGGTLRDELTRAELDADPASTASSRWSRATREPRAARGGLQEFGLPYAPTRR